MAVRLYQFIMGQLYATMMNADLDNYSYVICGCEVVVYDADGKKLVSCPTEDEAVEYIRSQIEGQQKLPEHYKNKIYFALEFVLDALKKEVLK